MIFVTKVEINNYSLSLSLLPVYSTESRNNKKIDGLLWHFLFVLFIISHFQI